MVPAYGAVGPGHSVSAMLIIVPFDIFLAKESGPLIVIALIHAVLLWQFRSAFTPLWSFKGKVTASLVSPTGQQP